MLPQIELLTASITMLPYIDPLTASITMLPQIELLTRFHNNVTLAP